jgi:hypothetical protein
MTRRFCSEVLASAGPPYAALWLSEPDHTGHHTRSAPSEHRAAILEADDQCRARSRAVEAWSATARGPPRVCSDHGMQTIRRRWTSMRAWSRRASRLRAIRATWWSRRKAPLRFLHFSPDARDRIPAVLEWLAREDFVGPVASGEELGA